MSVERVRESVIAGSWYPGSPQALENAIREYIDQVPSKAPNGALVALVSPHAGYVYSGPVAAHAYKLLEKRHFDTVVILAPSHRARFEGVSVYDQGGYRTPLGIVPLDEKLVEELEAKDPRIRYVPQAHSREHSLEIQLPFLQVTMPGFKLVPLVMGDQGWSTCQWLSKALAEAIGDRSVLVLASSDLSHFHSYEEARALDRKVIDEVEAFDPEGLHGKLSSGKCEACGGGPVVTALLTARLLGADKSEVLRYANSGDVTGDRSRVVGYMAAALWKRESTESEKREASAAEASEGPELSAEDKAFLHDIAGRAIENLLRGRSLSEIEPPSPLLKEPRGAFVTLRKQGRLRGCIGHILPRYPLAETIVRMARAAAFEDPRFPPLKEDELGELDVEISVLSPLRTVSDVKEIQVGRHGLYIRKGGYAGLLLPQVATEHGWDRKTFLEHTCLKAGLPKEAWKDGETKIQVFSADIF